MGLFKKIFENVSFAGLVKRYGTVEEWQRASKSEKKRYEENIKKGVETGQISRTMLGLFYFACKREVEGEEILHQAVLDGDKGAASDYFYSVSYYYMGKRIYNRQARKDQWFQRWIDAGEQCVAEGDKNAEVNLADVYNSCYAMKDPEIEKIIDRMIDLYEAATARRQQRGALNYGDFIEKVIGTDKYKKMNPAKYRNPEEAEKYYLQAVKDERNSQFYDSAVSAIVGFYSIAILRKINEALTTYLQNKDVELLASDIEETYKKAMKYAKKFLDKEKKKSEINLTNQLMRGYEFLVLVQKLEKEGQLDGELLEVKENFIEMLKPRKERNKTKITMEWGEIVDKLSQYYLDNKEELRRKGIKLSGEIERFIEKKLGTA